MFTDLYSFYKCLVKLSIIKKRSSKSDSAPVRGEAYEPTSLRTQ